MTQIPGFRTRRHIVRMAAAVAAGLPWMASTTHAVGKLGNDDGGLGGAKASGSGGGSGGAKGSIGAAPSGGSGGGGGAPGGGQTVATGSASISKDGQGHLTGSVSASVGSGASAGGESGDERGGEPDWGRGAGPGWGGRGGGAACFLKGTKIRTVSGETPVEDLRIGDVVETVEGRQARIKWVGFNRYKRPEKRRWPKSAIPVRIARHAIDDVSPTEDLYLSRDHALYIDDVLIPVKFLINQVNIVHDDTFPADTIDYFHIELDYHQVIFAAGACVESLLVYDQAVRERFSNFAEYNRLYSEDLHSCMDSFAPFVRYYGVSAETKGLLRLLVSGLIDIRDPIQIAYDRIAARARQVDAAKQGIERAL